ncbi:MAG: extracellular solute-binding protein [Chloroflexales bacterium]|nr:extracellular solute-binding protein [Chloroflexales bacterium]
MKPCSTVIWLFIISLMLSQCTVGERSEDTGDLQEVQPVFQDPTATTMASVITIGFAAPVSERPRYASLMSAFNTQHPDIQVQFIPLDSELDLQHIAKKADTAVLRLLPAPNVMSQYLADLAPFIDADATFQRADFYAGALEALSHDRELYALPTRLHVPLLAYNKTLWEAHALPVPKPDWNWNDLLTSAEQLSTSSRGSEQVYGFLDQSGGTLIALGALGAAGVSPFAAGDAAGRFDQAEAVSIVKRITTLIEQGVIYAPLPSPDQPTNPERLQALIREQRIGMWPAELFPASSSATSTSFQIGYLPIPPLPRPLLFPSEAYGMSKGTQHPQAAWRWLAFLSQQAVVSVGTATFDEVPARRSIATQSRYWGRQEEELRVALTKTLESAAPSSAGAVDPATIELLGQAVQAVVAKKQTVEVALQETQTVFEQAHRGHAVPTATPPDQPFVVLPPMPIAAPPADATVVRFRIVLGPAEDLIRQRVEAFNQQNLGVFVQLVENTETNSTASLANVANTADCFAWFDPPSAQEVTATLDLQPLIDADPTFNINDYPSSALHAFRHNGRLYGLPYALTLKVLIYNQTAFTQAGLSAPTAIWTLDEFLNAAQRLTTPPDKAQQYGFAAPNEWLLKNQLVFVLDRFGATAVRGGDDNPQPNFTDPTVMQAIRFYIDLLRQYSPHQRLTGYMPQRDDTELGNVFTAMLEGRVGMWFDSGVTIPPVYTVQGARLAIAPPPFGESRLTPHDVRANGLYIAATTKQPQACWLWLKYMSTDVSGLQGQFPARLSVSESPAFAAQGAPGAADVFAAYRQALTQTERIDHAGGSFYRSTIDYFWFYQAIDRALQGQNLETELAMAQVLTERYLQCLQTKAPGSVCATQIDPNYRGFQQSLP